MNLFLWILQVFAALTFIYSGISKSIFSEKKLVGMGQTGVEHLPLYFIRFIGLTEIAGVAGLILPMLTGIAPVLTPVAALCLALIMPFAARIHYQRKEFTAVGFNILVFIICMVIAIGRFKQYY